AAGRRGPVGGTGGRRERRRRIGRRARAGRTARLVIAPGDEVRLRSSGAVYDVGSILGAGGQGVVFEARPRLGGASVALKWYRQDAATRKQATRLERILDAGRPSDAFLWPLELAARAQSVGFGYVMPQRRDP